jgi:DNA-binding CsgD family transcriptional regulator
MTMTAMIEVSPDVPSDRSAASVLARLLGSPDANRVWVMAAFLLGAVARETLGDADAAGRGRRPPAGRGRRIRPAGTALTHGETRVLHYLPTNLSAREIAGELYLSVNTVKTHQRHLYQKLGARTRSQAVHQARALGLLISPLASRRQTRVPGRGFYGRGGGAEAAGWCRGQQQLPPSRHPGSPDT